MNPLLIAASVVGAALADAMLLGLCRVAGQGLPKEPGTGRCWYCAAPTESATGLCEEYRKAAA